MSTESLTNGSLYSCNFIEKDVRKIFGGGHDFSNYKQRGVRKKRTFYIMKPIDSTCFM